MTTRIDRRQFLMGTTALVAAGAVGTMPAWAQASSLRLTFWGGQARADRTYGVTDLYKASSGTDVEGEFLAWNDYWPKLATQTAGGNAPDVLQMDYRYIVEYAKRNAIAPLDEFIGTALKLDGFDADQLEGGKVDGKLYGISLGANSVAMIYNVAAFEEAGIELPTNAWTLDDLMAIGEAFKTANIRGGMKAIMDGSYSEPMLDNWLRQRGKALYTADGKLGFEEADAVEWYTMWAKLREAGVCVSAEDQALDTGPLETTMLVSATWRRNISHCALKPFWAGQLSGTSSQSLKKFMVCGWSGFQTGLGVLTRCWVQHLWRPATAEPLVPSTWKVTRSSRRTRVVQLELICAITPPSSSKVA